MFSSKLRVAAGTVVAITPNPAIPKRVAVGVIADGLKAKPTCAPFEDSINQDLANYWAALAAGDQTAKSAALAKYNEHVGEATANGCFVRYV